MKFNTKTIGGALTRAETRLNQVGDFKSPVTLTPEAKAKVDETKTKATATVKTWRNKMANTIAVSD